MMYIVNNLRRYRTRYKRGPQHLSRQYTSSGPCPYPKALAEAERIRVDSTDNFNPLPTYNTIRCIAWYADDRLCLRSDSGLSASGYHSGGWKTGCIWMDLRDELPKGEM
jgi:hypothetical protein